MSERKTAWDMMPAADRAALEADMRRRGQVVVPAVCAAAVAGLPKRTKFGAVKHTEDGFTFDSGLEWQRYQFLKAQEYVIHIDVHPIVTIDAGKHGRVSLDFGVWTKGEHGPQLHYSEVKSWAYFSNKPGKRIRKTEFMRVWQLFDNAHPCSPLHVVSRQSSKGPWLIKCRGFPDTETVETNAPEKGEWR